MRTVIARLSVFVFSIGVAFCGWPAQAETQAPSRMTIGFIPSENPQTLRENGAQLAQLLQARLGVPVEIYVSKDYVSLVDAMKDKKIDFAFFTATTFVFAKQMAGAKVLLKKVWHGPYYYSTILVRGDDAITSVKQLKGKKIAYVDKESASGYLYPQQYFKKEGIDADHYFSEVVYSGNHEKSIELLQQKKVDAVAVYSNDPKAKDTAWDKFGKITMKHAHSIWISAPIPNDPFCVRQDFYDQYPKYVHDMMFAMIEMNEDPKEGPRFKQLLGVSSLMLATSQQYDPVREMVKGLGIKLQ